MYIRVEKQTISLMDVCCYGSVCGIEQCLYKIDECPKYREFEDMLMKQIIISRTIKATIRGEPLLHRTPRARSYRDEYLTLTL